MDKEIISTQDAPAAIGPYEQAIVVGSLVFTSGQIAIDPSTNQFVGGDIAIQTKRVLDNLTAVLDAAGSSLKKVVKATIYVTDLSVFDTVNKIFGEYFKEFKPARSTVQVSALPKGALVEIDLISVRNSQV